MYIKNTIDSLLYVSSANKVNSVQEKLAWSLNCLSEILVENWLVSSIYVIFSFLL